MASARAPCASTRTAGRCRRSCIWRFSTRSTIITASRRSKRPRVALDIHNAAARWNKALLDNAARPSGALVYAGPDGALLSDRAVRAAEDELERHVQGAAQCRPAAAARRRARLEGDVAVAEGHGFPRGEERRGARDRARLRRAADAARHSRRQHLLELPGGQPRVLAPDACCRWSPRVGRRWRTGSRRRSASQLAVRADLDRIEALRADRAALWSRVSRPRSSPTTRSAPRSATRRG